MGAQTQTQTFLCAALAGATLWALPQPGPSPPLCRPFALFMSISLNLCWTAAQQAVEKPFCSNSKRQRGISGGMGWRLGECSRKIQRGQIMVQIKSAKKHQQLFFVF